MNYFGRILKAQTNGEKTRLQLELEENILPKINRYSKSTKSNVEIVLNDGRRITSDQRKKAYATLKDIADYIGDVPEYLKEYFKYDLMGRTGIAYFSLSNCSVTVAREYISLLIDFCIDWEIPLSDLAIHRVDDIDRYLYRCLVTRTCVITGQKNADIHHVNYSKVGMGRNRKKIDHSKLELIALSREWHTKIHAEGEEAIFKQFKIYGITLDYQDLKNLGIKAEEIN